MNVVLLLWRTRLRSSWRSAVILVVLIGLGGGVTLAVAAGARRTASANDAILDELNSSDVVTAIPPGQPDAALAALRSLPDVSGAELWIGFTGQTQGIPPAAIPAILGFWSERPGVDRPFLTSGRLPTGRSEAFLTKAPPTGPVSGSVRSCGWPSPTSRSATSSRWRSRSWASGCSPTR